MTAKVPAEHYRRRKRLRLPVNGVTFFQTRQQIIAEGKVATIFRTQERGVIRTDLTRALLVLEWPDDAKLLPQARGQLEQSAPGEPQRRRVKLAVA